MSQEEPRDTEPDVRITVSPELEQRMTDLASRLNKAAAPTSAEIGQQLTKAVMSSGASQLVAKQFGMGDELRKQMAKTFGISEEVSKHLERQLAPLHAGLAKQIVGSLGVMKLPETMKAADTLASQRLAGSPLMKQLTKRGPFIDPSFLDRQEEHMRDLSEGLARRARFDAKVKSAAIESLEVQRDVADAMKEIVVLDQRLVTTMNTMGGTLEEIQTEQKRVARRHRWPALALSIVGAAAALAMLGLTAAWHYLN